MYLLTLNHITLLDRPDFQTRSFYATVQSWMSQWTVANNYDQVMIENEEDECDGLLIWAKSLNASIAQAISEVYPHGRNVMEDFEFTYTMARVIPLKGIPTGMRRSKTASEVFDPTTSTK